MNFTTTDNPLNAQIPAPFIEPTTIPSVIDVIMQNGTLSQDTSSPVNVYLLAIILGLSILIIITIAVLLVLKLTQIGQLKDQRKGNNFKPIYLKAN